MMCFTPEPDEWSHRIMDFETTKANESSLPFSRRLGERRRKRMKIPGGEKQNTQSYREDLSK